jgi:hypothetical protein
MRIVLSRKGFDSSSGGAASPILRGRPVSLPIPAQGRSATTYGDLGLGELVERVTQGRIGRSHLCHEDPMFADGRCWFGQSGAAQSHLRNRGVGPGDVFLFFGLFADEHTGERHHRLFGYLRVDTLVLPSAGGLGGLERPHPHTLGEWDANNTIYCGEGAAASRAHDALRLTQPGGPLRHWIVPDWLRARGLSFHGKPQCWLADGRLKVVSRGQEFVADIGDDAVALEWLGGVIERIRA